MVTWAISIARIVRRRRLICQPPNTHPTTSPRRRPPDANAKRRIARSRVSPRQSIAQVAISRSKPSQATARLLLRCRGRGEAQTANRSAERRLGAPNGPSIPFQRCSVLQPASRRLTVLWHGAWGPFQRSDPSARRLSATFGRHSMSEVTHPLRRIPKMMRHEFQRERLRRRPRQRLAGGGVRPDL
jgi:hypothetical protein